MQFTFALMNKLERTFQIKNRADDDKISVKIYFALLNKKIPPLDGINFLLIGF